VHRFIIAKVFYMPKKHSVKISVVNQELRYDLNKETTIKDFVIDLFRRIGVPVYGYDKDFKNLVIYDSIDSRRLIREYLEISGKTFSEQDIEVNGNLI
jgi:hypothetical protein